MESLTTYCQASTQPLHRLAPNNRIHAPKCFHIHAPNNRIICTQQAHTLHPTTAYMHPTASAYMHPNSAYMHPKVFRIWLKSGLGHPHFCLSQASVWLPKPTLSCQCFVYCARLRPCIGCLKHLPVQPGVGLFCFSSTIGARAYWAYIHNPTKANKAI